MVANVVLMIFVVDQSNLRMNSLMMIEIDRDKIEMIDNSIVADDMLMIDPQIQMSAE
jgi:hypothetical protein